MQSFKNWLSESIVKGSVAGEAMRKTLEFKIDAEWIRWDLEKKGWISARGVKDSFDLAVAFYHAKIPKPMYFYLRSHAILERPDAEYDSIHGSDGMLIKASLFLFDGKTGLSSASDSGAKDLRSLVKINGHVMLAQRDDDINFASVFSEFDGSSLKTPLQLADWINKVISHVYIGNDDDDDDEDDNDNDEPEYPKLPNPAGRRLVTV